MTRRCPLCGGDHAPCTFAAGSLGCVNPDPCPNPCCSRPRTIGAGEVHKARQAGELDCGHFATIGRRYLVTAAGVTLCPGCASARCVMTTAERRMLLGVRGRE